MGDDGPARSGRRDFLRIVVVGGGVLAGIAGASTASEASAKAGRRGVAGVVVSAEPARLTLRTSGGSVVVTAAPGARLYSGASGQVHDLAAFVPGDRVVAEGVFASGVLVADSAGSVFEPLRLRVGRVDRAAAVAETDHGAIRLDGVLPFSRSGRRGAASELSAGDVVEGLSWRDPRTGGRCLLVAHGSAA